MRVDAKRLHRLAEAQSDLAELLERQIAAERQRGRELAAARDGTFAALTRLSTEGLAFYAAALRRLAELDEAVASSEAQRRDLLGRLLAARGRQEVLQRRADAEIARSERRALFEQTTESVVARQIKATGKGDMLK